jgi:opacity protein-like surface antigen
VKFKLGRKSAFAVPLAAVTVLIAGAGSAQAAASPDPAVARTPSVIQGVGLPYTGTVSGLSGGSDGVKSPVFATNSTGTICVDPNLHNQHDASSGVNNSNFRIELYKDNSINDELQRTAQFTLSSQPKTCFNGLTTNHNYYIKTKKNVFVEGQLMGGTVVISYS